MDVVRELRSRIAGEAIDYQTLLHALAGYRKPRDKISALLASGNLVRVKKGLYLFGEAYRRRPYSRELLANLIYGPSCVSLDYALAYHGMIPERVDVVTSVTTGKRRAFDTPVGRFTYTPLSVARYRCGIDRVESKPDVFFLMATPEKALLDKVWCDKRPRGRSLSDAWSHLVEDLRIDVDALVALNAGALQEISACYGSQKVARTVACLARMRRVGR